MLAEYPYFRRYLIAALEAQPVLFEKALEGLTAAEADRRPDAERFTIREAVAHLADWEGVWMERMTRICQEDHPTLPGYDESAWAVEHGYASKDPIEQLRLLQEGRRRLVDFLNTRADSDWQRTADRPEIGVLTLEALALLVTLHDTYHLRQVVDWRRA